MNERNLIVIFFLIISIACKKDKETGKSNTKTILKVSEVQKSKKKSIPIIKDNNTFSEEKIVKSNHFYVTEINKGNIDFSNTERTIFLKHKDGTTIIEIKVDAESYDNDAEIMEITNHNLDNIKRIISINIAECICGCSITNMYILETNNGNYIQLPNITYSAVESGEPEYNYTFGKKNTIYAIEKTYNYVESGIELNAINRYKKLLWNGYKIIDKIELASNSYSVSAKKGLIVRDKPDLKGNKIDSLPFKSQVIVQEKTNETLELMDDGNLIKGHWVKVENFSSNKWKTGYVFNGFLKKWKANNY